MFTESGEVVFGPKKPGRTKTANCFGIYYGDGKGLDACNIFAKVIDTDKQKLIDFAKAGQDNVTSSMCYYQQWFGLTFINLAFSC